MHIKPGPCRRGKGQWGGKGEQKGRRGKKEGKKRKDRICRRTTHMVPRQAWSASDVDLEQSQDPCPEEGGGDVGGGKKAMFKVLRLCATAVRRLRDALAGKGKAVSLAGPHYSRIHSASFGRQRGIRRDCVLLPAVLAPLDAFPLRVVQFGRHRTICSQVMRSNKTAPPPPLGAPRRLGLRTRTRTTGVFPRQESKISHGRVYPVSYAPHCRLWHDEAWSSSCLAPCAYLPHMLSRTVYGQHLRPKVKPSTPTGMDSGVSAPDI